MKLSRTFGQLVIGAFSIGVLWACITPPEVTQVGPPTSVHANFPLLGKHLSVDCEQCHIDGAIEQDLTATLDNGWVDGINGDCLGCHVDTREEVFPNFNHGNGFTCSADGGCHSVSDSCWREVRGPCVDLPTPEPGVPPPPFGHEGERTLLFPLEGVHLGPGCGDCHTGANDADQAGGAEHCEDCHTRADGPGANHYRHPNSTDDGARGCKACHAAEAADTKLLIPDGWITGSSVHDFIWPHHGADACLDCHTTPGSQTATDYTCTNSGCHAPDTISDAGYHQDPNGACADCHVEGI